MKKILIALLMFVVPAVFSFAVSTPAGWTDDFENAKKQAIREKKILLVDFTGTDWCKWCKVLEKEVLSKKEFVSAAQKNFVLVFIDIPNDTNRLSKIGKARNKKLVERYGIKEFPTIALMDPSGIIIDRAGYQAGGPKKYVSMLEAKLAGKKELIGKLREIHNARGADKAKRIDAWLAKKSIDEQKIAIDWVNELVAIDANGALGLRKKYAYFTDYLPVEEAVAAFAKEYFETRKKYFAAIPSDKKKDTAFVTAENVKFMKSWEPKFDEISRKISSAKMKSGRNGDPRAFDELQARIDLLQGKAR